MGICERGLGGGDSEEERGVRGEVRGKRGEGIGES